MVNWIHLNPKTSLQTQSLSASPPKKESGSNCVSSTRSGSRCNSRRWMATRWVGEYRQVADSSYVQGKRVKTVVLAPQSSIVLSPEDVDDLETRASFTISSDELPQYNLLYVGQQKVDELHCFVFDIAPKRLEKGKRYFQGRLWVDDQDFQIVKNKGKSVPDIRIVKKKKVQENLFPQFATWREQIGKYWFPTFSSADDTLPFRTVHVRIKQVLKFTDYKKK